MKRKLNQTFERNGRIRLGRNEGKIQKGRRKKAKRILSKLNLTISLLES